MQKFRQRTAKAGFCLFILFALFVMLRINNDWIRPHYAPQSILVNPAGTCALTEYDFHGSRFSHLDAYRQFIGAQGDAFYTITDLRTGHRVRDSLTNPTAIAAVSRTIDDSGSIDFYWSRDGSTAAFPATPGPAHEWAQLQVCRGSRPVSPYASLACAPDDTRPACMEIRKQL